MIYLRLKTKWGIRIYKQKAKLSCCGLPRISGFLMTEPICLRAWAPAFCTFMCESVSTSHKRGTILGRQEDNCFGAQNAMAPSSSTLPENTSQNIVKQTCETNNEGRLTMILEWFSIECRKAKTQAIILTNHSRRKQCNEPIFEALTCNLRKARENFTFATALKTALIQENSASHQS